MDAGTESCIFFKFCCSTINPLWNGPISANQQLLQGRNYTGLLGRGDQGQDSLTFLLPPLQFWTVLSTWGVGLSCSSEMFFCFLWKVDFFKISLSTIHQNEPFGVHNSKNFLLGRVSPNPLLRPTPNSFSGFALDSRLAIKSRALCALDSGDARFGPFITVEAWLPPWVALLQNGTTGLPAVLRRNIPYHFISVSNK